MKRRDASAPTPNAIPTCVQILGGPIVNPANGHTYFILPNKGWAASEADARALGGYLVTINDSAENSFIFDTFSTFGGRNRSLWLGLNDVESEGTFVWSNGEPVTYTHWDPSAPNNCCGGEDYAHTTPNEGGWQAGWRNRYWNDISDRPGGTLEPLGTPIHGVVEFNSNPIQNLCQTPISPSPSPTHSPTTTAPPTPIPSASPTSTRGNSGAVAVFVEDFEDNEVDSRVTVERLRISDVTESGRGAGPKVTSSLAGARAFGFGRSDCAASCFDAYMTTFRIGFEAPVWICSVSFKYRELFSDWGSWISVIVDSESIASFDAGAFNSQQEDPIVSDAYIAVRRTSREVVLRVTDITSSSEMFIDDIVILGEISPTVTVMAVATRNQ